MQIDAFKEFIETPWFEKFEPFLKSNDFENLWEKLRTRKELGKTTYPFSGRLLEKFPGIENTIFKPFNETVHRHLRVIIVDTCPTLEISTEDRKPIARGLANPEGFFEAIEEAFGTSMPVDDLFYLNNQGVMMLNCSLTRDESATHTKLWEPFMKYFFNEVLQDFTGLHIVFIGERPQNYSTCIKYPKSHFIYEVDCIDAETLTTINSRLVETKQSVIWDYNDFIRDLPF